MSKLKILSLVMFASTVIFASDFAGYHEGYLGNFNPPSHAITSNSREPYRDDEKPVETKFVSAQKELTALQQELCSAGVDAVRKKAIEDQISRLQDELNNIFGC